MSDVGSVHEWKEIANEGERGDDSCVPLFYLREVQNKARSDVEGRVCFDQKEYVEIFVPGEKTLRPNRPVTDADKKRWPVAYAKFQRTREETLDGTPVEQWPYLNRAQVAEMKANGIMTVEAIADVPDGLIDRLGPNGRDLQTRAMQFLKPQSEIETELRDEVAGLQTALKESNMALQNVTARLQAMEQQADKSGEQDVPPVKRPRGRPRKNAA